MSTNASSGQESGGRTDPQPAHRNELAAAADEKTLKRARWEHLRLTACPDTGPPGLTKAITPQLSNCFPHYMHSTEQHRRLSRLRAEMEDADIDCLLVASYDYRGHKGTIRYVTDYNFDHRFGFAVLSAENGPELVLPQGLRWLENDSWVEEPRASPDPIGEIVDCIEEFGGAERVGIVGHDIMKAGHYLDLEEQLTGANIVDATDLFERVRTEKTYEELAGFKRSNRIAEVGHMRLRETLRPNMQEQEAAAELYEAMFAAGGYDTIILTMRGNGDGWGPYFGSPKTKTAPLTEDDRWMVSIEVTDPSGYWVELARTYTFGEVDPETESLVEDYNAINEAAVSKLRPGVTAGEVQDVIEDTATELGLDVGHLSGHGIGQDVIEEPIIGEGETTELTKDMVISLHPHVVLENENGCVYMSDIYKVTSDGGEPLSDIPREVFVID